MTTMFPRFARATAMLALATGPSVVLMAPAHAEDQAALKQITELNKKALEAYDNLEPEEARKLLMQALEVCASAGLNNHPLKARTHVHLGVVLIGGFKQRDLAIRQFKRAIEIQPDIKLTRSLVNPETQSAFDEAKAGGGGGTAEVKPETKPEPKPEEAKPVETKPEPKAETKPRGDAPPENIKGIYHRPIAEARPGAPIEVKAAVQSDLDFTKLIVAYRPEGASDFLQRPMQKGDDGWYSARIPEVATQGGLVSYYIEARAKGDKTVAANGSALEPHVITIAVGAGPVADAGGGGSSAGGDTAVSGKAEQPGDHEEPRASGAKSFWIALGIGSGFGWFKGTPEVNTTVPVKDDQGNVSYVSSEGSATGMASLLHIAPEVFFPISSNLILSAQGRFQILSGATSVYDSKNCGGGGVCKPAAGAVAVLAKATYLLNDDSSFRPFVSGMAGVGQIRHIVTIGTPLPGCGGADGVEGTCKDTVVSGPVLAGAGAGFFYDLTGSLAFLAELNLLAGVPNPTFNVDFSAGLALGF